MIESLYLSEIEKSVIESIRQLKFGAVEVVVHDSKIVQLEKSEKIRFDKKPDTEFGLPEDRKQKVKTTN